MKNGSTQLFGNDSSITSHLVGHIILLYVGSPMILTGILSSILSTIIFSKDNFTPRSTKFILQTLAITDFLFLTSVIFYVELKTMFLVHPHLTSVLKPFREAFIFHDLIVMLVNISELFRNWLTVLIGIERYFVTCHPLKMTKYQDTNTSYNAVFLVGIFTVLLRVPMLIRRITVYSNSEPVKHISDKSVRVHQTSEAIFQACLPVIILLFCFVKISKALKKSKILRIFHRNNAVSIKRKTHITRMLIIIILLFSFCTTPNIISAILILNQLPDMIIITQLCWLCSIFYSSSNFFVYIIYMKRYRYIMAKIFTKEGWCYSNIESPDNKYQLVSSYRDRTSRIKIK